MNATLEPPAADTGETAETFAPLASEAAPCVPPAPALHTFQGKALFPFDAGSHLIVKEAVSGIRSDELLSLVTLAVLTDLQTGVDHYRRDGWDAAKLAPALGEEEATDAATGDVLAAIGDSKLLQARASQWQKSIGRKGVKQAVALVARIVTEYNAANPEED